MNRKVFEILIICAVTGATVVLLGNSVFRQDHRGRHNNHFSDIHADLYYTPIDKPTSDATSPPLDVLFIGHLPDNARRDSLKPLFQLADQIVTPTRDLSPVDHIPCEEETDTCLTIIRFSMPPTGNAPVDDFSLQNMIRQEKVDRPSTPVAVFIHGGHNGGRTAAQEMRMRQIIDAGATWVISANGSTMQEIAPYGTGWIFYGLGAPFPAGAGTASRGGAASYALAARLTIPMQEPGAPAIMQLYPIHTGGPEPVLVDPEQNNQAYWNMLMRVFRPTDRWLKRRLLPGQDEGGRFWRLVQEIK